MDSILKEQSVQQNVAKIGYSRPKSLYLFIQFSFF